MLRGHGVDGALIGGARLHPDPFLEIVRAGIGAASQGGNDSDHTNRNIVAVSRPRDVPSLIAGCSSWAPPGHRAQAPRNLYRVRALTAMEREHARPVPVNTVQ
jgi:hypothetical protein